MGGLVGLLHGLFLARGVCFATVPPPPLCERLDWKTLKATLRPQRSPLCNHTTAEMGRPDSTTSANVCPAVGDVRAKMAFPFGTITAMRLGKGGGLSLLKLTSPLPPHPLSGGKQKGGKQCNFMPPIAPGPASCTQMSKPAPQKFRNQVTHLLTTAQHMELVLFFLREWPPGPPLQVLPS